ncbi:D-proline reductase (dithiol) proprotein PrdA [Tepidimicrobium xylanilyticum]|uniref:D-proline reductase (Dithiol) PrdA n=1 Tax=Tepidimicrobium xylanilyticum TaxID=1123352 RepID=A0A1H3CFD2_9FIRM|nr:D-proline reductase (dithiol) proprotein PrdA [Tepidimicrobium xylanilyticum]GMG98014.1 D-proline reductase (dithiol) proprotein PrdA [Tepidimicrobium xylanilyticum]SDX52294.1 D-proline reductase (dithiol) PrdA [Tepidimicrobium xylanilyticum]
MAITIEQAEEHKNDFAVTCCRFEAGEVIKPSNIEDPKILPDLEDSGLINIPDNCLTIGQVLGKKLLKTVEALTPLTPDLVDGVNEISQEISEVREEIKKETNETDFQKGLGTNIPASSNNQFVRIHIGEGKDINLEIPICSWGDFPDTGILPIESNCPTADKEINVDEEKIIRTLVRKHIKIDKVEFGEETKIEGTTLYIRKDIAKDAMDSQELVTDLEIDIITPDRYGEYSDTIMDVQPIAVKEKGQLGEGITRVIDGVVVIVTGIDENGVQIGEFGSSEGEMDRNILFGRPGSPDEGEILIKTKVTIKAGKNMERPGPMSVHRATDFITQEIREVLKKVDESLVYKVEELVQKRRPNRKKVLIIKEIMGQGAMHDNFLMPDEPVGTVGAKANVDLGNVPVVVTPLQILDGCVHALTCIGPASKETSRHYWREPLVMEAMEDEEIDLAGVVLIGSPQANSEKFYVSRLLGSMIETMDLDGAIVTTEGFGNNHIDFASHIEQVGMRGVPVVGMTFAAVQGQLVVGNKYMDAMIDLNKSRQGIENEILSNNCLTQEDAIRALAMLKLKMAGEKIEKADRKWNPNVKEENIRLIEKVTGRKIERPVNETSLKISEKRRTIYEKDEE